MTVASPSIENVKGSDNTAETVRAVVTAQRAVSSTVIAVNSLVGFNTNFIGTTGALDADNKLTVRPQVFFGHISGSNIEIDSFAPGYTDLGNEVGDIVVIKPTTSWADEVAALLGVSHNDDGTIKDGAVTNAKLATGAGQPGGAWTSFPAGVSGSGTALGNGTVTGYYTRIGRTVHAVSTFTLGSTSTVGAALNFSVPAIDTSNYTVGMSVVGLVTMRDASSAATYTAWARIESSGVVRVILIGTTGQHTATSTTAPFTWTTNDSASIAVTYLSS